MKKVSLRSKLIRWFVATSLLPIIVLGIYSYYNIARTLSENTAVMTESNMKHIDNNLNIWLESYEDLLYQIYTDDNMVKWTAQVANESEQAIAINQMRRFMNALINTKEYVRSITIITPDGQVISCDQMTPATYRNSWLDKFSMTQDELYQHVIDDYDTHVYSTEFGTNFANKDYYLFHMAHRIIDYRKLDRECGIAVVSIDEDFLQNVCQNFTQDGRVFDFIVDDRGRIISFGTATDQIGTVVTDMNLPDDERLDEYRTFLKGNNIYAGTTSDVYLFHDDTLQWDIVNVSDQSGLIIAQRKQMLLIIMLGLVAMVATVIFSTGMSRQFISSVRKIVERMRMAQSGDLSVRVEKDETMPLEIESIADGFNDMFDKLRHAIDTQQQAQIAALESQINPHFLYNTLDTINWMAIDKDEYDISNAISSLANILRYAIVNSNAEVRVQDEVDWLKKYVYLQQYRLKGNFSCNIDVEPETQNASMHKLLLQPFIENAIVHGFDKNQDRAVISVSIARDGNLLSIEISDNGMGMDSKKMDEINNGIIEQGSNNGIGIKNVITRMKMYYGNEASIEAKGSYPTGTCITIKLPYSEK